MLSLPGQSQIDDSIKSLASQIEERDIVEMAELTQISSFELSPALLSKRSNEPLITLANKVDLEFLRQEVESLKTTQAPIKKDSNERYFGISLHSRTTCDDFEAGLHREQTGYSLENSTSYNHWNSQALGLKALEDLFPHFQLVRGRLLVLDAGGSVPAHRDEFDSWRLHIPIQTDPAVRFQIDNRSFFLPADGSMFLLNVFKPHSVINGSDHAREHLVFVLSPNV